MKKITINPVTRIEGHAKISVFVDDRNRVENVFFQATEFRGYEKILLGLPMEEVPRIVSTICGICRGIHFVAALKAADRVFNAEVSEAAEKIREMLIYSHFIEDHTITLFALGLPDYISPKERDVFGVVKKLGTTAKEIIRKRSYALKIMEILGGKSMHPVAAIPGGWSKRLSEEERERIERYSKELVELGKILVSILEKEAEKMDKLELNLNFLATSKKGEYNLYDGERVVIDPDGKIVEKFSGEDYEEFIGEKSVEWSYSKLPYLKKLGWKGLQEDKSFYVTGPLARLNVSKISTPLAKEKAERLFEFGKPCKNVIFNHWARAIEVLLCAEKLEELAGDKTVTGSVRGEVKKIGGEGVGVVEAPRGLLIHHYKTDGRGVVKWINLIVATTQNTPAINIALKKAARKISKGRFSEKTLEAFERVVRAFDPCMSCATHSVSGKIPIEVEIWREGKLIRRVRN